MSETKKPPAPVTGLWRRSRRIKISQPVRLRPSDPNYTEEVQTTVNLSRDGLYFTTALKHYYVGMQVRVTVPYRPSDPVHKVSRRGGAR